LLKVVIELTVVLFMNQAATSPADRQLRMIAEHATARRSSSRPLA
jgi:hypothetical protein